MQIFYTFQGRNYERSSHNFYINIFREIPERAKGKIKFEKCQNFIDPLERGKTYGNKVNIF